MSEIARWRRRRCSPLLSQPDPPTRALSSVAIRLGLSRQRPARPDPSGTLARHRPDAGRPSARTVSSTSRTVVSALSSDRVSPRHVRSAWTFSWPGTLGRPPTLPIAEPARHVRLPWRHRLLTVQMASLLQVVGTTPVSWTARTGLLCVPPMRRAIHERDHGDDPFCRVTGQAGPRRLTLKS